MRSTQASKTSRVRLGRRSRLVGLPARQRVPVVRGYLYRWLREVFPDVALDHVAVAPWSGRGRASGFRVEVVAHLPGRRSEVFIVDRAMTASHAESQMAVGLLALSRRVWTADVQIEQTSARESYCVATLWADSLRLPCSRRA